MGLKEIPQKSPEEIEEEAKEYPVVTFADILRALKTHPDWLEEIRKIILTSELLELPKKVDELLKKVEKLEEDVGTLKQDVDILKQDVAILKQDVATLKQDVAILKQDVATLKQDVAILKQEVAILKQEVAILKQDVAYLKGEFGRFKGKEFERTVREKFFAFFGQILRKARLIPIETILPILEEAEEKGKISESQFESILKLDLIVEGVIKSTKKPVILAVEVSYSIFEEDLKRAEERAALLAFLLEREIIPTVVGVEVKEEIVKIAEERGIFLIKTDY